MKSVLFPRFGENLRPVWRFWQLWPSKMRVGQNVLRMTWKEGFVQFSWKAHCFPVLKRIWDKSNDFEKFDPQSTIWAKPPGMTWKERFVQFSWKAHCFPVLKRIWGQCDEFENFDAHKFDLAKTCCAWPETSVLYNFHEKRTCFPILERIYGQCDDFDNFDAHKCDLAKTCCAWPEKSVLYNFHEKRIVFPFWREFTVSVTILTTLTLYKFDLAKACRAWSGKSVLYNFHGKRTAFLFRWQFQASLTILRTLTLKSAVWAKPPAHDLKRAFCTIFMKSALFSRFEEFFRPVWRIWYLWPSQMRFGQNVLRMTWKERFVQFSWKAHCFPELWRSKMQFGQNVLRMTWKERFVLFSWKAHYFLVFKRIWDKSNDFEKFDPQKYDLGKTSCAWPETSVLYNFHGKRTVFSFWGQFQASLTILTTLTLKNAIWPKRAAHDLKRGFCTIFMKSVLFPRFGENFRPVWRFWQLWR